MKKPIEETVVDGADAKRQRMPMRLLWKMKDAS